MDSTNEKINEQLNNFREVYSAIALYNHSKVLKAFKECNITTEAFNGSTGYGYNDYGRNKLNMLYSNIFKGEDALVSSNFASGTHTIYTVFRGLLDYGDKIVSLTGDLYDTLEKAIWDDSGLVKKMAITYDKISLNSEDKIDNDVIKNQNFKKYKMAIIQRSRGYSTRRSITIDEIEITAKLIKKYSPNTIIFVDNCYGEFVEKAEPIEVGADIIAGSLIKNPGGTIAQSGGYIVGRKDLIEQISDTFTVPGIGKEIGCENSFDLRLMFQGIFLAPRIVEECLVTAYYTALLFNGLGYIVSPNTNETRTDIIQSITFNDKNKLIKFIQTIQEYSPVDSMAIPHPWDMPGYDTQVIMASGSFISGSSLELSADAPIREPYIAYLQGSTSFYYSKIAIDKAAEAIEKKK
ncbi:MAG: aluminum resistance family protein [Fusobacteria bacterium]|nr:MAG: aluminum resistance family protein [Fusobacteriota bacterium]KAF0229843.1 MAG: aluminum resistance family [Fusobacteriota bacterium]